MATQPLPGAGTGDDADTGLDPVDWAAFRTLAHRMLDDSLDHIAGRRDQPVWQPMPDAVRAAFDGPLPRAPEGLEAAYDDFRRTVVPYSMGNDHPRFWGWYMGAGNPVGNLADLLASVLNPNMGGADHAPVLVEQQVVRWCAEAVGYPTSASGLLVTGASEANLVGLAVARTVRIGPEVRTDGIPGGRRFGVYASTEVHSCHRKSLELLGLGESSLRTVPVRDDYTMDVDALAAAIAADRAAGIEPLAVVATVGTINTGSVDDLEAIADLCEARGPVAARRRRHRRLPRPELAPGCRARARACRLPRARPAQVDAGPHRRRARPGARRGRPPGDVLGGAALPAALHPRAGRG